MASPDDGRGRRGCKATSAGPKLSLLLPADGGASLGSRWGWRGSVPGSKKAKVFIDGDDGMVTSFSKTESQFSLSSMYLDMPGMDDYLQLQHDFIVCTVRAKHACATHPRSIAERERRTRISKRLLRRLQQLVPNMDKQKNTSDMLHIAVDYIKVSPTLRMSTPPSTPPASSGPLVVRGWRGGAGAGGWSVCGRQRAAAGSGDRERAGLARMRRRDGAGSSARIPGGVTARRRGSPPPPLRPPSCSGL